MGVIGRLDDQVNEIIIKPVSARKRTESEGAQAAHQESVAQSQEGTAAERAQDEENRAARSRELPVWLL